MLILLARIVFVAFVATLGDYVWFEFGVRHTPLHGVLHGAALLLAVGLVLGHQRSGVYWGWTACDRSLSLSSVGSTGVYPWSRALSSPTFKGCRTF